MSRGETHVSINLLASTHLLLYRIKYIRLLQAQILLNFIIVLQITILRNFYSFKFAKFIPCKMYFMVIINFQIVHIVLIMYVSYVIRMSLVCTRMSSVCHPYVTRMYSYVIRMSLGCHSYAIRMSLVCYSYVIRMSIVFSFTIKLFIAYVQVRSQGGGEWGEEGGGLSPARLEQVQSALNRKHVFFDAMP